MDVRCLKGFADSGNSMSKVMAHESGKAYYFCPGLELKLRMHERVCPGFTIKPVKAKGTVYGHCSICCARIEVYQKKFRKLSPKGNMGRHKKYQKKLEDV